MAFYTTKTKTVHCERWDIDVPITAKYIYMDSNSNPYRARFAFATCPLVESAATSPDEQQEEFKYMRCRYSRDCELLTDFASIIDTRQNRC